MDLVATNGGLHAVALLRGDVPLAELGPASTDVTEVERSIVAAAAARGVIVAGLAGYGLPGVPTGLPAGVVLGYAEPTTPDLVAALTVVAEELRARR